MIESAYLHLPDNWSNSVVVRHIDAPYSAEALAEPYTDTLDLGVVDLTNIEPATIDPYLEGIDKDNCVIKLSRERASIPEDQQSVAYLHEGFTQAARTILGEERYDRSSVFFRQVIRPISRGEFVTYGQPHMDGCPPGVSNYDHPFQSEAKGLLRLNGMASSVLGTGTLHGPLRRYDFQGDKGTELCPGERSHLKEEVLEPGHLYIAAPSLVHFALRAPQDIERRHFFRWQLFVD